MGVAEALLERLEFLGVTVHAESKTLVVTPASRLPPELVEELRQHKPEILLLLRRRTELKAPRTVDAPLRWHAEEIARRVGAEGICVFWSDQLKDMIAFVTDEAHLPQVPTGIVTFTFDELQHIFPAGEEGLSKSALRLIFEAKRLGDARVIDVRRDEDAQ